MCPYEDETVTLRTTRSPEQMLAQYVPAKPTETSSSWTLLYVAALH